MFTRDAYELSTKRVYLENLCNCLFIFIRRTVMVTVTKMNKLCFTPLLTLPQGCHGCQKIWMTKLKSTLVSWSAKIQPKIEETVKNRQN